VLPGSLLITHPEFLRAQVTTVFSVAPDGGFTLELEFCAERQAYVLKPNDIAIRSRCPFSSRHAIFRSR
jgi:hypothetical protein